jgi:acetyltransferase-like isoleucine patch superfamily enzyme
MAEIRLVGFVRRFLRTLSLRQMATVWAEDFLGMLIRPIPGFSGFTLRWLFYRVLFKRLGGYSFIYKGVYFEHCYGIDAGKNLHVSAGAVLYGRGGLTIGDDVMIGHYATIYSSQHRWDGEDPTLPMIHQGHKSAPVTIGNDVWIGAHATVLPGVNIATGTVVAAGAVVNRDTEPYSIVGGVPARTIGHRPRAAVGAHPTLSAIAGDPPRDEQALPPPHP